MKNILERYLIFVLALLPVLSGCSGNEPEPSEPVPAPGILADTYLKLSIATAEAPTPASSYSRADNPEYEAPVIDNEKIKTMRFIIVDGSGHVEHNVLINQTNKPDVLAETPSYRVSPNDTKKIYLIGNEASLPESVIKPFQNLSALDVFPSGWDDVTLSLPALAGEGAIQAPLYSVNQPIPMTEFHEVEIGAPKIDTDGNNVPYEVPLFVTRTAVKFTFNLTIKVDDATAALVKEINVGNLIIDRIADKEYLFPKATTYEPAKAHDHRNRTVTAYTVPSDLNNISFPVSWTQGDDIFHYTSGPVYLPETKYTPEGATTDTPYTISLPINDAVLTAPLPNVPASYSLPRNTHVIVDITVEGPMIICEVRLVPYTGIYLNPDFGIERPAKPATSTK